MRGKEKRKIGMTNEISLLYRKQCHAYERNWDTKEKLSNHFLIESYLIEFTDSLKQKIGFQLNSFCGLIVGANYCSSP